MWMKELREKCGKNFVERGTNILDNVGGMSRVVGEIFHEIFYESARNSFMNLPWILLWICQEIFCESARKSFMNLPGNLWKHIYLVCVKWPCLIIGQCNYYSCLTSSLWWEARYIVMYKYINIHSKYITACLTLIKNVYLKLDQPKIFPLFYFPSLLPQDSVVSFHLLYVLISMWLGN